MKRADLLSRLTESPVYDLVVIGGGATGLGVALDAALRGFSVLILESHDFASGTSSRSTKLLHGGVRYLAQGNISLVREALHERACVLQIAPHLAQPLPFVMPSYHWWQQPFYGLGLKLYDLLAGDAGLGQTELLNRQETLEALPGVARQGLRGGVKYWDGQFDDARLALALARTLQAQSGHALNYMEVTRVGRVSKVRPDGACFELALNNRREEGHYQVMARAVVNAAGVWVDEVRAQAFESQHRQEPQRLVSASQGVHLVVSQSFLPGRHALLVPRTQDGRVLFAVPWLGSLILGTTDTPRQDLPREPLAFEEEVNFILHEASKVLSRPVQRSDVTSVWVGLRPLVAQQHGDALTKSLSREHTIVTDVNGLITVTGGKWTTYRAMAEEVMSACFEAGLLPWRVAGASVHHHLVGANQSQQQHALTDPPNWHLFGDEQAHVRACVDSDRPLGMGLTEAMVRFAARHEFAWTVEDILARRWRALFLDSQQAKDMAPAVAQILQEETGLDPQLDAFETLCEHYACR